MDIDHLRDVVTIDYNQDLKIGYHEGHAIINDVIELENNYTETNFDEWRQHWIDTYRAASSAPSRKVHFDKTAKTTSAHRVLKSAGKDASRSGRSATTLPIAQEKTRLCRGFALGDHNSGKFPAWQRRSATWQQQQLHHVSVSEGRMTSPTSNTTSKSQRQRGQDSTDDLELGKLMGARTNTHSATSSNLDTAVYANLDTAELGYGVPVELGYLHACMPPDLARLGQEASTSRIYSKVVGNGVYKGRKC